MKRYSLIKKANYRHTSRTKRWLIFTGLAGCILVLGLIAPRVTGVVTAIMWYPIDSVRIWIHTAESSFPVYIRERIALDKELDNLRRQLAAQSGTRSSINRLVEENQKLRELLGAVPGDRQVVRVIARPNTLPYDTLMIDQGSLQGIVEKAPVYLGQDQVVGYISAVRPTTALVTLVTSPGFSATAFISGPDIFTLTEGMGGGVMRVRVPQGINLQLDDLVLLPAVDSGVYGQIFSIETAPTQPEQFGYIAPPVPLQSLRYVSVGSDPIVTQDFSEASDMVAKVVDDFFRLDLPEGVLVSPQQSATTSTSTVSTTTDTSQ